MAPKETAKERKEREKAEALAQAQLLERRQSEVAEERERQHHETLERIERMEMTSEFYAWMVNPASRLMVRRTEYDAIRQTMMVDAAAKAKQVDQLTEQFLFMQKQYSTVQEDLVHLRSDCRALHQTVKREYLAMSAEVGEALRSCISQIESDILSHREDVAQCGTHLNRTLEDARQRSIQLAKTTLHAAERVTGLLQSSHNAMHTRIPLRIRKLLSQMEPTDLILMFDTLSFDDHTLKYLQYRFPPPSDDPFRVEDL